jgi:hypothetical protein
MPVSRRRKKRVVEPVTHKNQWRDFSSRPQPSPSYAERFTADVRGDIARIVQGLDCTPSRHSNAGSCLYRALTGQWFLRMLGLSTTLAAGGMVYRVGPDPLRDVVSYCGPGNAGQYISGEGLLGHIWLQNGPGIYDDVIDFSCADWKAGMSMALMIPTGTPLFGMTERVPVDNLGEIVWEVDPPSYIWETGRRLRQIAGQHTPDIGHAFYCGWVGEPPPLDADDINWYDVNTYFAAGCRKYDLRSRLNR